ncbi:MAG: alkaline phosphatase D family protein [Egibacteraceae bacterium]
MFQKHGRRRFLTAAGTLAGALAASRIPACAWPARQAQTEYPFTLGVASGEPEPFGVVLWTRLAPQPLEPGGGMPAGSVQVEWEIGTDPDLTRVVQRGADTATPEDGHSVHIEVTGLEPARPYWYRFRANTELSPIGRTKTAPPPDSSPARLAFAFASCQNYENGHYTAYQHMAGDDLDIVLHLGDYIYEGAPRDGQPRRHIGPEPVDLDTYRMRYALYKSDPDLRAAHAAFPWIVTWDDHEVDNDYAGDQSQDFDDPVAFLARRAAAYKAYWEHLPLRRNARPGGPDLLLYRRFSFGDLAEFNVLDTRQYRDDQACGGDAEGGGQVVPAGDCPQLADPGRTILGADQMRWLLDGLGHTQARWNVLAQQYRMAELDEEPGPGVGYWTDDWDGYQADRARILSFFEQAGTSNPVTIGGDIHSFWVNDLKPDFRDPASPVVASEFVGTSISSSGVPYDEFAAFLPDNPHIKFFDSRLRGYVRCTVTPQLLTADLQVLDTVETPGAPARTLATYAVEHNRPGPQPA